VNLAGNRLLPTGAEAIISSITREVRELNLSDNFLNSRNTKKHKEKVLVRRMPADLTPNRFGGEVVKPVKSLDLMARFTTRKPTIKKVI
jgi:hypothetical protein